MRNLGFTKPIVLAIILSLVAIVIGISNLSAQSLGKKHGEIFPEAIAIQELQVEEWVTLEVRKAKEGVSISIFEYHIVISAPENNETFRVTNAKMVADDVIIGRMVSMNDNVESSFIVSSSEEVKIFGFGSPTKRYLFIETKEEAGKLQL